MVSRRCNDNNKWPDPDQNFAACFVTIPRFIVYEPEYVGVSSASSSFHA